MKSIPSQDSVVQKLGLEKHPEGGYYKEVYRSDEQLQHLPERFKGPRSIATSIYFLLGGNDKSHFHKIKSDETWHFYLGAALELHQIDEEGTYSKVRIGANILGGEVLQYTVPKNVWFAAQSADAHSYSLMGCTVAPGFDFQDFELAAASELVAVCKAQEVLIKEFCLNP